ncbi:MAG TPA: hypothetical protein VLW85_03150 [Myxococcales bacterium]|nr:hypothetical protein [Myxococcales bacterium]
MWVARALLAAAVIAAAAHADGSATTLLDSRPYLRGNGTYQETPVYEAFSVNTGTEGGDVLQDLRFVARGWGRLTLGDPFDGDRGTGDLDSAFLEGKLFKRHLTLRLGRQLAVGGALRATQIDGATLRALIAGGIGFEAWGGVPVVPRFNESVGGDLLGGARLFWRHAFDTELGASVIYVEKSHQLAREDVAFDGSYSYSRDLNLSGIAQWSLAEQRFEEGRLAMAWQPARWMQLTLDGQRTAPDLFLDRNSIFAVFSDETRDEAGAELVLRPTSVFTLTGDYHWMKVMGGEGARASLLATFKFPRAATWGAELRLLTQPDNGYKLARIFMIRPLLRALTLTLDLDAYWLEQAIVQAQKRALSGTVTAAWTFSPSWDAMVAATLGETPNFSQRTEIVARVAYRFGLPRGAP